MQLSALRPMLPSSLAGLALIFGGLIVTSSAMAQEDPLAARRAINHAVDIRPQRFIIANGHSGSEVFERFDIGEVMILTKCGILGLIH